MILTKATGLIMGPISALMGWLFSLIYNLFYGLNIYSIGFSIIVFTVIIRLAIFPLSVKMTRNSKIQQYLQPEFNKITKKYKGKKDQDSMVAQNEEMQAVYKKYGVSPSGSCIQLAIQMPILFALYRVIYNMPAYVEKVKETLLPLAQQILDTKGAAEFVQSFAGIKQLTYSDFNTAEGIMDILNRATSAEWNSIAEKYPQFDSFDAVYTFV